MPERGLRLDAVNSLVRVAVANAVAETLITGIDNAKEEGHVLTQLQQIDLAVMGVLAAHEAIRHAEANATVESQLTDLARRLRPTA